MALDIGCIFKSAVMSWWYSFVAGAKAHRRVILILRKNWRNYGVKIMTDKLSTYDPAAALVTDEEAAFFMADALETGDAGYIANALGIIARAKGMSQIAAQTGLSREQLYRSFSENGNPTLKTTLVVMKALGLELTTKLPVAA
jgi:probable addiction module antidote protein